MSVGVVIVAGGRGARVGAEVPKQLLDLGGRSILQRSVDAFDSHPSVGEVVVVLPETLVDSAPSFVSTTRPCSFVAGGARRQDSVRRGLHHLTSSVELVLIHDAARPFVDAALVERVIVAARRTGAAVPAVQARDTVKHTAPDGTRVLKTIPRDQVWLAQTPQGFRADLLRDVVGDDGAADVTDEAMLVEGAGQPVELVDGDPRNIKITTPDDLAQARRTLESAPRVGTGYDLHRLAPGRPLVLAGIVVTTDVGPESHSDGDVVCHALVDAILGAAGAGDIGTLFPNTDAAWKDAPGLDLLTRACAAVRRRGLAVASVDVTVVLEKPKLAPHIPAIRRALAPVLAVADDRVSIKAKTNERVDAVGRGEAIAAHAVAVLVVA